MTISTQPKLFTLNPDTFGTILEFAANPGLTKLRNVCRVFYTQVTKMYREAAEGYRQQPGLQSFIPTHLPLLASETVFVHQVYGAVMSAPRLQGPAASSCPVPRQLCRTTLNPSQLAVAAQEVIDFQLVEFFRTLMLQPQLQDKLAELPLPFARNSERAARIRTWLRENPHQFDEITSLDLRNANINGIPPEIVAFPNLTELSLQGTRVRRLPTNLEQLMPGCHVTMPA